MLAVLAALLATAALLLAALTGLLALLARTLVRVLLVGIRHSQYSTELQLRPMPIENNAWETRWFHPITKETCDHARQFIGNGNRI